MGKDILEGIKPTPHYKKYPKSLMTARIMYIAGVSVIVFFIIKYWDFWATLFR